MRTEKYILVGGLALIFLFVVLSPRDMPVVSQGGQTYISGLTWLNSLEAGIEQASSTGKPIMVYIWATWCKYCEQLEKDTYVNPEVNAIMKDNLVLVAINIDEQGDLAARFGVGAPPAEIFLTPNGEEITRIPGYVSASEFLQVLKQVTRA
jgi:thioredoxin-related protein